MNAYESPPSAPTLAIGDVTVSTAKGTVTTPSGTFQLRGTTWTLQDSTRSQQEVPPWAAVGSAICLVVAAWMTLGVILSHGSPGPWNYPATPTRLFCFVGLCTAMLLLRGLRRTREVGFVAVTVCGGGLFHAVRLPPDLGTVSWATSTVHHIQALAARAQ